MQQPLPKPSDKIVVCADLDLLEFPLESLKLLHNNFAISSLSRDFSLQFLSTRINLNKELELMPKDEKKDNKKTDAKADKKGAAGTQELLPEGAITVDHSRFKYLVDMFNETSNGCKILIKKLKWFHLIKMINLFF